MTTLTDSYRMHIVYGFDNGNTVLSLFIFIYNSNSITKIMNQSRFTWENLYLNIRNQYALSKDSYPLKKRSSRINFLAKLLDDVSAI